MAKLSTENCKKVYNFSKAVDEEIQCNSDTNAKESKKNYDLSMYIFKDCLVKKYNICNKITLKKFLTKSF